MRWRSGMRMRRVPELRFKYDDSVDKGERIETLLREQARDLAPPATTSRTEPARCQVAED